MPPPPRLRPNFHRTYTFTNFTPHLQEGPMTAASSVRCPRGLLLMALLFASGSPMLAQVLQMPTPPAPSAPPPPPTSPAPIVMTMPLESTGDEPVPRAPVRATHLYAVTIRAEIVGHGRVPSMKVNIASLGANHGTSGTTDASGELHIQLAAGDYAVDAAQGSVHVRKRIHVSALGTQLVLLSVPQQPPRRRHIRSSPRKRAGRRSGRERAGPADRASSAAYVLCLWPVPARRS